MRFRIIASLLLLAVLAAVYVVVEGWGGANSPASKSSPASSAPSGGNPLRDFQVPKVQ